MNHETRKIFSSIAKLYLSIAVSLVLIAGLVQGCGDEDKTTVIPVEIINPNISAKLDGAAVIVTEIVRDVDVKIKPNADLSLLVDGYGIWLDRPKNKELEAEFREENNIPEEERVVLPERWVYWTFFGKVRNNTDESYTPTEWYAIVEGHKLGTTFATIPKSIPPGGEMPFFISTESLILARLDDEFRYELILAAPPIN